MKNKPLDNYWFSSMGNLLQLSCADLVLEKNVTKNDKIKIITYKWTFKEEGGMNIVGIKMVVFFLLCMLLHFYILIFIYIM